MKRNKKNKLFGLLGAMLLFTTVFVTGVKAEETGQEEVYPLSGQVDLFALDWTKETDETINHYLGMSDWVTIGHWLVSMEPEERDALLERDTLLVQKTSVMEPGAEAPLETLFYEYAMKNAAMQSPMMRAAYPVKTSGYWQTHFIKLNASGTAVNTAVVTYKVSGIDAAVPTTKQQSITISKSVTGNWCDISWADTSQGISTYKESADDSTYPLARAYMNFQKPAGYTASVTYNINSGFRHIYWSPADTFRMPSFFDGSGVLTGVERKSYPTNTTVNGISTASLLKSEASVRHYLVSIVNIYMNAGIGTTANPTQGNLIQTITFSPSKYNVNYSGNGATGGAVASQSCVYDATYTTQSNGYTREYTINYNGNGGTPDIASQKVKYIFKGWGMNQTSAFSYNPGAGFKNLSAADGGTVSMFALWNPVSVTLPSATRQGYRFLGWNIGKAGTSYTPTEDVTATAQWQANTYTIKFDSNGGDACENLSVRYDAAVELPQPQRPGYTFGGWNYSGGNYKGSVKNLTEADGETIELCAEWTANTDTPYTVRYWTKASMEAETVLSEEKIFYGTTDEIVTIQPPVMEGYETPALQTLKIAGDGSAVADFYYTAIPKAPEPEEEKSKKMPGSENAESKIPSGSAHGLSVSLIIDGAAYEIAQNPDGTLGVKSISASGTSITVPDVVRIENQIYRVTEIYEKAFKNNKTLQEVELSANISSIGVSAFEGCTSLKKVTLHSGLVTIGNKAFKGCKSLTSFKFPKSVQTIGNCAFQDCSKLKTVTLNNGLIKIGTKAFYKCCVLTKITIPKTTLKIGSYAFAKCKKLKTLKFASDAQLLSMAEGTFSECVSLSKVTLPSKLIKIPSKAFYKCSKLKTVDIGEGVSSIGSSAFRYCKKLGNVKGGKGLVRINKHAFRDCAALTKITLHSKLQKIEKYAFYKCVKLKKVTIKTKALTSVGTKAFKKCKKRITFVVPKSKKDAYSRMFRGKY